MCVCAMCMCVVHVSCVCAMYQYMSQQTLLLSYLFKLTPDLGALVERGDLSMDQAKTMMVCQSVGQSDCCLKQK